jgi:hypothetical protein
VKRVYQWAIASWRALLDGLEGRESGQSCRFWLLITIFFWFMPLLFVIRKIAQHYPYIVRDDARHFVVWLRRYSEPGIYPNDPIAEHFIAVTPWLYKTPFWLFGKLGIDPLVVEPLIVFPAMAIAWSIVCFKFVHRLWTSAAGAAIATIVLSYMIIGPTTLGLPRGVTHTSVLLLLLLFLGRHVAVIGPAVLAVWGIFPVSGLVAGVSMGLLMLRPRPPFVTTERAAWLVLITAGMFTLAGAFFYMLALDRTGPTTTIEEARKMPIFGPGGRKEFFAPSSTRFYLCHRRSGLFGSCGGGSVVDAIKHIVVILAVIGFGLWLTGSKRAASLYVRFASRHRTGD